MELRGQEELISRYSSLWPALARPVGGAEVEMRFDQLIDASMLGQGGLQQEHRIGHQTVVVEAGLQAVQVCDDRINQVLLCRA